ncbi:MAG: undecaprenyl-diphosphate phosphatase [Desulfobacula sp.]|nr:undecaprenyl-diphosphate phosphatase [Desulfobacula sp.]
MELHQGIILGILQGLTEFLPVSSSGHLILGQSFFGMTQSQLSFDISVHMGTLLAVLLVYASDILAICSSVIRFIVSIMGKKPLKEQINNDVYLQMAGVIVIGSIPTAVIGLFLKKFEHILFSSTLLVGCMLLLTGSILWASRRFHNVEQDKTPISTKTSFDISTKTSSGIGIKKGLIIGIVQGLAVIPGISRSGSTIATGMFLGIDRQKAATFSFLLSIPAIIGAEILGVKDMLGGSLSIDTVTIWATIVSFITGLIALKILIKVVHAGKFHFFAPYCWFLGVMAIGLKFI